jgi:TonB family protein
MTRSILIILLSSVSIIGFSPQRLLADKTDERYKQACGLLMQGELQGAQTEFENILKKKPKYENAKIMLGVTLTKLSEQAEKKGDRTGALAELRRALELDGDEAYWHSALARLLKAQGDFGEAQKEWQQAAQLSPDDYALAQEAGSGASQTPKENDGSNPAVKTSATAGAYNVGGEVKAPFPISKPEPPYDEKSRKAHFQGTVAMEIMVNAQGGVEEASVLKAAGLGLDQNALRTVRTWKFQPATYRGTPVPVRIKVEVSFRLF